MIRKMEKRLLQKYLKTEEKKKTSPLTPTVCAANTAKHVFIVLLGYWR